jgi:hypothetical protein
MGQLGYPSELDAVTSRLPGILKSATQQILVAARPDDSRIDGYVGLERRLTLHQDENVEITDLVVDAAARRSGVGCALVTAGEQCGAAQDGLHTMVVRGDEQQHNAKTAVAVGGALLVDDADLDPIWIETTLIPVLTDPGQVAAMSASASAAGAPDADVVLGAPRFR